MSSEKQTTPFFTQQTLFHFPSRSVAAEEDEVSSLAVHFFIFSFFNLLQFFHFFIFHFLTCSFMFFHFLSFSFIFIHFFIFVHFLFLCWVLKI